MRTSATNRRLRILLTAIRQGTLIPQPEFQRRLVWTNKHKNAFVKTVLEGFPFPEIYIAAGDVNPETGEGTEMLVDGQQRLTTLYQYFIGADDLKLAKEILNYADLDEKQKVDFLEYEVVIRDLGQKTIQEIIEIFTRINSTNYSLNAMEIHNARFDGEFKRFAEDLAHDDFFEKHRVFKGSEIRRMNDTSFVLTIIITIMSTYFNRDSELENFLKQYNDEFEEKDKIHKQIKDVFHFIDACNLGDGSRAWQKADLLTLIVEIHKALYVHKLKLEPDQIANLLGAFYSRVEQVPRGKEKNERIIAYHTATVQATNDRGNRISRGEIIQDLIQGKMKI